MSKATPLRALTDRGRRRAAEAGRHGAEVLRRAGREFLEDQGTQIAAAISYYSLLSVFPLAIVMVAMFGALVGDDAARERVVDFVLEAVPLTEGEGRERLETALRDVTADAGAGGLLGLAALMFTASGLMGSVRHGVNRAWHCGRRLPFVRGKLLDLLLVISMGAVVVLSLLLTLFVRIAEGLRAELEEGLGIFGTWLAEMPLGVAQLAPLILSFAVFAVLMRVLPACPVALRDVWPGALVAAVGYELAKTGFSLYLETFADYGAVYGPLGAVIAFAVFVFVAANVFLFGTEVASEWPAVRDRPPARDDRGGGRDEARRGAAGAGGGPG